jgi:hypothetical protein
VAAADADRQKKPKRKNDPRLVAAARELRDRWLERVNRGENEQLLPSRGKYDVTACLPAPPASFAAIVEQPEAGSVRLLNVA